MSKYTAKAALREAKNLAKGYTDMQIKVREATSNDPWGPSGAQMAELADASFNTINFQEIMEMLDKRLNDSGKNWRHVFKALTVLDYLIHSGSEQVVAYAKQNLYVIKTLKEFQYIDENGKDQGINVREKSKAIAGLLTDEERLKEERRQRQALRDRMASGSVSAQYGTNVYAKSSYQPHGDEDQQLQRAIEESRRTAAEHERRQREKEREDNELQKALELSKETHKQQQPFAATSFSNNNASSTQSQGIDLWGSTDQQKHDLDFFASMSNPAPVNSAPQPDPFGIMPPPQQQMQSNLFNAPVQQQQQQAFGTFGAQPAQNATFGTQNAFGAFGGSGSNLAGFQPAQPQQNAFANPQPGAGNFATFDAFDNGASQKNFIPKHMQGQNNPAAQLAQIARNASTIDPFANLAANSSSPAMQRPMNGYGNAPIMSSAAPAPTQNPWNQQSQSFGGMNVMSPVPASAPAVSNASAFSTAPAAAPYTGSLVKATGGDPFASLDPFGGAKSGVSGNQASTAPKLAPPMGASASTMGGMNGMGGGFGQPSMMQPQQQNFGGMGMSNSNSGFMNNNNMGFGGQPMQGQMQAQRMNSQFQQPQQQQPQQQNFFF